MAGSGASGASGAASAREEASQDSRSRNGKGTQLRARVARQQLTRDAGSAASVSSEEGEQRPSFGLLLPRKEALEAV